MDSELQKVTRKPFMNCSGKTQMHEQCRPVNRAASLAAIRPTKASARPSPDHHHC